MTLVVNPTTRPFGLLHHKPSKDPGLAHLCLPQYQTGHMFLTIFGNPKTRRLDTPYHIVYHWPVMALITEPGSQPPDWKGSGLCCFVPSAGGWEGSCSSPDPSLSPSGHIRPDGIPASIRKVLLGYRPSPAAWLGLRHPYPLLVTLFPPPQSTPCSWLWVCRSCSQSEASFSLHLWKAREHRREHLGGWKRPQGAIQVNTSSPPLSLSFPCPLLFI